MADLADCVAVEARITAAGGVPGPAVTTAASWQGHASANPIWDGAPADSPPTKAVNHPVRTAWPPLTFAAAHPVLPERRPCRPSSYRPRPAGPNSTVIA